MIMVYQMRIWLSLWFKTSWITKTDEKDFASRQNVVFHRVPEKRSDKVEERKDSDYICVTELDGVFNIKLQENVEWYRKNVPSGALVSRKKSSPACYFQKNWKWETLSYEISKILRNPIEKFRGVGISPDSHTNEREDIRKMIEEA